MEIIQKIIIVNFFYCQASRCNSLNPPPAVDHSEEWEKYEK